MRIASLSPAATEILFAMGRSDWIVCCDQFSNFPEEAKNIPSVMGHQKIDPALLTSHAPEIVLTGTVVQGRLAEKLKEEGFAVIHQDPRTLAGIAQSITELGAFFDAAERAEALMLAMRQGFNDVKKKAALLPRRLRVYVEEWHQPPFASGNWVPEIVRIAGGEQFPVADGELSREVTLGEVAAFDPDLIVISWCGAGRLAQKELLTGREGWGSLRAVRDSKVKVIDDSLLNRPGPRLVEGARQLYGWLFECLH